MAGFLQSDLGQSVLVTVAGMAMVFVTLGGLMLIIAGLQRVFRDKPATTAGPLAQPVRPLPEVEATAQDDEEEIAAAIAVALAVLQQRKETLPAPKTTVVTFAPGTGAWQALGRLS